MENIMFRMLLNFLIYDVAFETIDLALLRIRTTGAMFEHNYRTGMRSMHHHPRRRH
jgi:hypothetical protein